MQGWISSRSELFVRFSQTVFTGVGILDQGALSARTGFLLGVADLGADAFSFGDEAFVAEPGNGADGSK